MRMMANALEGMTEEELSDASQWDMYGSVSFGHSVSRGPAGHCSRGDRHHRTPSSPLCQAVDLAGIFVALVLVSTKVSR